MSLKDKVLHYTDLLITENPQAARFLEENKNDEDFMAIAIPLATFCSKIVEVMDLRDELAKMLAKIGDY